jgi:hypothetical protein
MGFVNDSRTKPIPIMSEPLAGPQTGQLTESRAERAKAA